jgi:hypothetical protein
VTFRPEPRPQRTPMVMTVGFLLLTKFFTQMTIVTTFEGYIPSELPSVL